MATSVDEGTEPEWTPEELALERQWWTSFRLELAKIEEKRMTWKDYQRDMASLRAVFPEVADLVEHNNELASGELEREGKAKVIPVGESQLKAILKNAIELKKMEEDEQRKKLEDKLEDDVSLFILSQALADYNGGDK